ncbi:MAG: hypothetical protein Q4F40_04415 [Akkermansia sp.]|nr:hypothetical protein [Akkermansia sp.]
MDMQNDPLPQNEQREPEPGEFYPLNRMSLLYYESTGYAPGADFPTTNTPSYEPEDNTLYE